MTNYLHILNLVFSAFELDDRYTLNLTRIPAPGSCTQSAADNTNTIVCVIRAEFAGGSQRYVIIKSKMWYTDELSSIEICDSSMSTIEKGHYEDITTDNGYARLIIDLIKENCR